MTLFLSPDTPMRTLAIDLGTRRVGLALSDEGGRFATPYEVAQVTAPEQAIDRALDVIDKEGVEQVVLGLPLNMDGSEGPRAQSTRAFARNLAQKTPLPIVFWDERLSTSAVTRMLIEADTRRDKRAAVVDKLAASYILQGFLDRLRISP